MSNLVNNQIVMPVRKALAERAAWNSVKRKYALSEVHQGEQLVFALTLTPERPMATDVSVTFTFALNARFPQLRFATVNDSVNGQRIQCMSLHSTRSYIRGLDHEAYINLNAILGNILDRVLTVHRQERYCYLYGFPEISPPARLVG